MVIARRKSKDKCMADGADVVSFLLQKLQAFATPECMEDAKIIILARNGIHNLTKGAATVLGFWERGGSRN